MNYFELVSDFWELNSVDPFPQSDSLLYLFLIHKCNSGRWINPFLLSTATIQYELNMSRDTIDVAKNRLAQRGLIKFNQGKGRGKRYYQLTKAKITGEEIVMGEKQKSGIVGNIAENSDNKQKQLSEISTIVPTITPTINEIPPIIDKDIKTKDGPPSPLGQQQLFSEKQLRQPKKKPKPKDPPLIPTIEQVKKEFVVCGAPGRIGDLWELEAQAFYDYFNKQEWRNSKGRLILSNWEGECAYWITKKEIEIKSNQQTANGTKAKARKEDVYSDRRGVDADSKADKEWDVPL
ncbi:MAG: helix-turn-helix domain-containing protein [Bacteroidales bacterium]|nr:helix-turn-helix domain-containing protein [Bacteroidales bacterium]